MGHCAEQVVGTALLGLAAPGRSGRVAATSRCARHRGAALCQVAALRGRPSQLRFGEGLP